MHRERAEWISTSRSACSFSSFFFEGRWIFLSLFSIFFVSLTIVPLIWSWSGGIQFPATHSLTYTPTAAACIRCSYSFDYHYFFDLIKRDSWLWSHVAARKNTSFLWLWMGIRHAKPALFLLLLLPSPKTCSNNNMTTNGLMCVHVEKWVRWHSCVWSMSEDR